MLKHTHFCRQHLVPLFVKQISQLFRKLYFRIHDPLCFARLSVPLVEPHSAKFSCTQPCQQFLPIQRTLFQPPGLSYCLNMVAGRAGGVGEDLSLTRTSSPPDPPKSIHLNPFHYTATKSSFTPLEVTTGQDKIYGHTAQGE